MRKIINGIAVLVLMLILALPGLAAPVLAEEEPGEVGDERVDITSKFTDVNFRTEVYRFINKAQGDPIYDTDVAEIKELDIKYREIKSLSGLEYFIGLETFNCAGNLLVSLDVSKNKALTELVCWDNQLVALDVSKNENLTYLDCDENRLSVLDITANTKLEILYCGGNQLASLDVSKNTKLKELVCYYNLLTKLSVSNNTKLTVLYCDNNKLTTLDVSKNTALTMLGCSYNQLNSLDVSKNTALTELTCWSNQLISLDVSKNTKLINLDCDENKLSALDLTTNTKLEALYCSDNRLTSLDVSNNTALKTLCCAYNQMPFEPIGIQNLRLDFYMFDPQTVEPAINITDEFTDQNFKAAVYKILDKDPDSSIYDIDVADIAELDVSGMEIASLAGVEYFVGLEVLNCSNNLLTELDLSNNVKLRELDCSHNLMLQPPTGVDSSKLDKYVFDVQDVKKPISALYFIIGSVVLFCLAGGVVLVLVLKRKKKKAASSTVTEPMIAPELAFVPEAAGDQETISWTALWREPLTEQPPFPDDEQNELVGWPDEELKNEELAPKE